MQTKNKRIIIVVVLLIVVAVTVAVVAMLNKANVTSTIDSFEDCVAAGYPVMESYPEQCAVPGGQSFTKQY